MSDCHREFQDFYKKIKLSPPKRESLKTARNAIRDRIRKYFRENLKARVPNFHGQGSYAMHTIVNPINGEYDIDDGVYLNNLDEDRSKWPTAETVHRWIYNAVEGHTSQKPINKRACVRVVYAGHYHVDLPIYGIYNGLPYLAEKGKTEWTLSDPKALTDWFVDQVKNKGEQLKRVVMYLKAWADNKSGLGKLPPSLVLTVLAAENYVSSDRDDKAFTETVRKIKNRILISPIIVNPVNTSELLSDKLTQSQMNNFRERLSTLLTNADNALYEDNKEKACKLWVEEFGDRFPASKDEDIKYAAAPVVIKDPAKPWLW